MVDMQEHWRQMDEMIAATPMPQEYRDFAVEILCADCHESSSCVFHVVGLKCGACGSYNTARTGQEVAPDATPAGTGEGSGAQEEDDDDRSQEAAHEDGRSNS